MVGYGNQKVVPNTIGVKAKAVVNGAVTNDQVTVTVNLYDIIVQMKLKNNTLTEPTAAHDKAASLEFAYTGVDGLDNSFAGGSGAQTLGLKRTVICWHDLQVLMWLIAQFIIGIPHYLPLGHKMLNLCELQLLGIFAGGH